MLRLKAKKETGHILHSVNEADNQVSRAAKSLPQWTFSKRFVEKLIQSWQAHLERIEVGEWWREFGDDYIFRDGDNDPTNYHNIQGPTLLHFQTSSLKDVSDRQKAAWKQIIDQHVHLLTSSTSIYLTGFGKT